MPTTVHGAKSEAPVAGTGLWKAHCREPTIGTVLPTPSVLQDGRHFQNTKGAKMATREQPDYPFGKDPELLVSYDPEWDILTLSNGTPTSVGISIAEGLMVFVEELEEGDAPHIITLEGAAATLRDILVGKVAVSKHPAGQPLPS